MIVNRIVEINGLKLSYLDNVVRDTEYNNIKCTSQKFELLAYNKYGCNPDFYITNPKYKNELEILFYDNEKQFDDIKTIKWYDCVKNCYPAFCNANA